MILSTKIEDCFWVLLFCKLLKLFFRVDFKILLLLLVYLLLVSYLTQHHLLAPTSTSRSYQSRSSHSAVFLRKGVLKVCSKFTGEHPCQSVISIKLLWNFIEITLWHGCSPVNLLHIFRTRFLKNTSGWLLLTFISVLR